MFSPLFISMGVLQQGAPPPPLSPVSTEMIDFFSIPNRSCTTKHIATSHKYETIDFPGSCEGIGFHNFIPETFLSKLFIEGMKMKMKMVGGFALYCNALFYVKLNKK